MNFAQYMAQNAQEEQKTQQEQQAQDVLTVEQVAARQAAEQYYSLSAQAAAAIEAGIAPAAMLQLIINALFGDNSQQAAAVAELIEQEKYPGGHELAIADIRQQRRLLNQQRRQHEAQLKELGTEIEALNKAERALFTAKAAADEQKTGLIDIMAFCQALPGAAPDPDIITEAQRLFEKHRGNSAAMGLLYGSLTEINHSMYSAGRFDMIQMQEITELKAQILAAIK